eukprot:Gregarina_sp_Poly_1__1823@NODE_1473_length_4052_cov_207_277290_g976_i0_p1_GENE_NODE_1473_length_4052_cov_207_277290_g976_i0NODE_1473_length_4052_cov_207_277290_g976_i0_p1_ORF_typecomplete_len1194_score141_48LRR_6/PF13516_6/0_012LRR_6/PF13516_6/53LRR_6/PF13516_6/8_NODE_1473_length_4052_cov_207_277290_g976_i0983679
MSSQRYSPQGTTSNSRSHRPRAPGGGPRAAVAAGTVSMYPARCVRCETTEPLNSFLSSGRPRAKKGESVASSKLLDTADAPHISLTSVCLARLAISDNDVPLRLLPYLEEHIVRAPCPVHERDCASSRVTWINLDLSENHLGDAGICALVNWWLTRLPVLRIRSIKLYKNAIADEGAAALGRLVRVHPWPIEEIHLSHNVLTDAGAEVLLKSFLFVVPPSRDSMPCPNGLNNNGSQFVYPRFDPVKSVFLPVWVRLEYNHISSCDEVLRRTLLCLLEHQRRGSGGEASGASNCDAGRLACFAERRGSPAVKDPNCSPKRCSKSTAVSAPLFHLYSFAHQLSAAGSPLQLSPAKSLSPNNANLEHPTSPSTKVPSRSVLTSKPRISPASGKGDGTTAKNRNSKHGVSDRSISRSEIFKRSVLRPHRPGLPVPIETEESVRPEGGGSSRKRPKSDTPLYIFLDGTAFLVMSTLDVALRGESGLSPAAHCRLPGDGNGCTAGTDALPFTWRALLSRCVHLAAAVSPRGDGTPPGPSQCTAGDSDGDGSASAEEGAAGSPVCRGEAQTGSSSAASSSGSSVPNSSADLQLIVFRSADCELQSLLPQQPHHVQLALESAEASCLASLSHSRYALLVRLTDGGLIPDKSSNRGLTSMEAGVAKTEFHLATHIIRLVDSILKFLPGHASEDASHLLLTESRNLLAFISWLREHRDSLRTSCHASSGRRQDSSIPASEPSSSAHFPRLYVSYVHPFNQALLACFAGGVSDRLLRPELLDAAHIRACFPLIATFMRQSSLPVAATDTAAAGSQACGDSRNQRPEFRQIPAANGRKFSVPQSTSSIWGHHRDQSTDDTLDTHHLPRSRYVFNSGAVPFPLDGSAFSDMGRVSPQDAPTAGTFISRPSPSPIPNRSAASSEVTEGHRIGRAASDVPICDDPAGRAGLDSHAYRHRDTHKEWNDVAHHENVDCLTVPNRRTVEGWHRGQNVGIGEISAEISSALRDVAQLLHQLEQLKIVLSRPTSGIGAGNLEEGGASEDPAAAESPNNNVSESAMHVERCIGLGQRMFERWGSLVSRCLPTTSNFDQFRDQTCPWHDGAASSHTGDAFGQSSTAFDPLLAAADTTDEQSTPSNSNPRHPSRASLPPDGRPPAYFTQLVNKLNSLIQGAPPAVAPTSVVTTHPGSTGCHHPSPTTSSADRYNML